MIECMGKDKPDKPDITAREMGKLGGPARAKKLSAKRRTEIAREGAIKRWNNWRKKNKKKG